MKARQGIIQSAYFIAVMFTYRLSFLKDVPISIQLLASNFLLWYMRITAISVSEALVMMFWTLVLLMWFTCIQIKVSASSCCWQVRWLLPLSPPRYWHRIWNNTQRKQGTHLFPMICTYCGDSYYVIRNCCNCSLNYLNLSKSALPFGRCCPGPVIMYSFSSRPFLARSFIKMHAANPP